MLVIIGGSTASGKTDFAAKLAKKLNTDIISADSMQIYRGMNIGTAKVLDSELGVSQHCIDIANPSESFTVYNYREHAETAIKEVESGGKIPIIAGGTGFYINSLLFELNYGIERNNQLENVLNEQLKRDGAIKLHGKLASIDPQAAKKIHPNNTRRLIRALAVVLDTNKPFSSQNTSKEPLRPYKMFVLEAASREDLYARIDKRLEKMIAQGLKDEVQSLLNNNVDFSMQSMQGIGYKEWKGYFNNDASIEEVSQLIKKNTRAYAKRQQTWFNNQYKEVEKIIINSPSDIDKYTDKIAKLLLKTS